MTLQETRPARLLGQSRKLQNVVYEIRGPANAHAARLEAEGHRILKLNVGNPGAFGFEGRWSFCARYLPDSPCAGLPKSKIAELYREADAILQDPNPPPDFIHVEGSPLA